MPVARTVIASVAVHAAAVAAIGSIVIHRERVVRPALPEPAPIEVVMLDPDPAAPVGTGEVGAGDGDDVAAPAPGPARIVAHAHGHGIGVAETHGGGAGTGPGTTEPAHGTGRDFMKMRYPELHAATLSFDPDKHPLPPPVPISGRMAQHGSGAVIYDRVTTVKIDPDGKAHFHDRPDGEIHFILPIPSRAQLGDMLRKWYEDPYAQTRAGPAQELSPVDQSVEGTWSNGLAPSPLNDARGGGTGGGGTVPILGGGFDITAWAMRKAHVGDPYAARKRALLDVTREERAERGGAYRAQQLAKSTEIMRGNLETLWRTTADPAERRATLFQLWDECGEGDGPLGASGERARAQVIGWIRARLPAGSPDAFTAAEVAALDAKRTSKQRFAP